MADTIEPKGGTPNFFELDLDLEQDLGIDFPISEMTARQLGLLLADKIKERTRDDGKPLTGGTFTEYSEKYAKRKGVAPSDVDLTLFGDMLDSITVTDVFSDSIVIGFDDQDQVPKAYNHHTGDTVPERPFFGLTKSEIASVKRELRGRLQREKTQNQNQRQEKEQIQEVADQEIQSLVDAIRSGIRFSFRPPGE